MRVALGQLQWTPSEFWASTPHDLMAAIDGHNEQFQPDSMTGDELDDMMSRFPDKKVA